MISPTSSSYPILGAALAAGVDYGLALELAFCLVNDASDERQQAVDLAIIERHGLGFHADLWIRLDQAIDEGRLTHRSVA